MPSRPPSRPPAEILQRLRPVRLLCLDMDGVLTDGHLYYMSAGSWSQRFCVRDGYGLKLLQASGVEIAVPSGGDVPSGRARAESLGIRHAYFGLSDKVTVFHDVAGALGLSPHQAAFIGDELPDIPLLRSVGRRLQQVAQGGQMGLPQDSRRQLRTAHRLSAVRTRRGPEAPEAPYFPVRKKSATRSAVTAGASSDRS